MKKLLAFILTVFAIASINLFQVEDAAAQGYLPTIGTSAIKDTFTVSNAADTSRQFLNNFQYKTVTVEIYQSATSAWKVYQLAYPVQDVDKFKIWYAQGDSSITISGYMGGEWIQLPFFDYSATTLTRKIQLLGGGTAWLRMRGFQYEFKL